MNTETFISLSFTAFFAAITAISFMEGKIAMQEKLRTAIAEQAIAMDCE